MTALINKILASKMGVQLFILAIVLLSWIIGFQLTNAIRKDAQTSTAVEVSTQVKEIINDIEKEKIATNFPDFNSLSSLHKLNIVNNFESWTPSAKIDPRKTRAVIVLDKGELGKGYLYLKASVGKKPLSRWESLYVQMNYRGGHLLRTKSLSVPLTSESTELLYALDDISYVVTVPYRENDDYNKTNWFNLFKPNAQIRIDTFISSLKPAVIEEMSLYYDCADNSECLLSVK